ncbi:MAG: hypothetical protein BWY50_02020 [Spirochaetes bacterium ADurb.Bin315]|nr:MAG: hypothetical protein BWY50_02020 [Spirochaetes bacterium ADurb.Bin315]
MIRRIIPVGSMMNTALTVLLALDGCIMPSCMATAPVSAIMGNGILTPRFSSIHSTHLMWLNTWSMERPMSLAPIFSNSSFFLAKPTNSVVHTGVKSAG